MAHTLRRSLVRALITGCLATLAVPLCARDTATPPELETLFALYDRESDARLKQQLAAQIDAAAHQKYATVSRLYWHTDLASARIAARASGRPILHLRMLGRLDEDLSCANSRLFRATLYANTDISAFLRERFVLSWSSERPVPRVTIDYGDGRKLERTTTGNSAHYVLDDEGRVLDVLPGLYAPAAFRRELAGSLSLAARVQGKPDQERAQIIAAYHQQRELDARRDWQRLSATLRIEARPQPLQSIVQGDLAVAQLRTVSKSTLELRDLKQFAKGLAPEALPEDQIEMWSAIGQSLYGSAHRRVIDEASRSLIVGLYDAVPPNLRATPQQRDAMIARLEQTLLADSALNQLRLRPQIARQIVRYRGRADFATLNAWVYAEVFRTPKEDAWLGLMPRNVFTGLPGDGVVMR